MVSQTIPASVTLLQTVSETLAGWIDWIQSEGPEWTAVRSGLTGTPTPESTRVLQTMLLATLTMFEGVGTPSIAGITPTDNGITVHWVGGSSDTLTWGANDAHFIRFSHYVAHRVLGLPAQGKKTAVYPNVIPGVKTKLSYYLSALTTTHSRVTGLIQSDISHSFDGNVDPVFLFVVLGCLPLDQLNALFLYIQRFLPDGLSIKNATGKSVMVSQLFQPATDVRFMVEKTNLYLDLFTTPHLPIIREITRAKTIAYFQKLMATPAVKDGVLENLKGIITYQITPRTQLYSLLNRIIDRI